MWRLSLAMVVCGGTALFSSKCRAEEPPENRPAARFRLPENPRYVGRVVSVEGGKVQAVASQEGPSGRDEGPFEEGYFLAVVAKDAEESRAGKAHLLRARIVEVGADGEVVLQQTPAAAKRLAEGYLLAVFAVPGVSQEELAALPELVPLEIGPEERTAAGGSERLRSQALWNARVIALGLHTYADINKAFPPAILNGPDGRPWHSWRVLLLPYLDEVELYERYQFDEPWDGPNNRKLLDEMPAVYGDAVHGDNDEDYTHFVAVTGDGMAFSAEGGAFDGDGDAAQVRRAARQAGTRVSAFTDEMSNSILVGSIDPERKIPWTKPEDIVVGEDFPGIGAKGGFAAPHALGGDRSGIFLFADYTAFALATGISDGALRKLLTIAGGETVDEAEWRSARSAASGRRRADPTIEYREGDDGPVAVLSMVREGANEVPVQKESNADE